MRWKDVEDAHQRIAPRVRRTPVERSAWLEELTGCETFLKLENFQHTGSFKVRGALNAVLQTEPGERFVTATSGNHGAALVWALAPYGIKPLILVPIMADEAKVARLRRLGAEIEIFGQDAAEAEAEARARAVTRGWRYVSPYNDPNVVAGQGTVALELVEDAGPLDAVFVAVGGGGLVGGMASWLSARAPSTVVFGCSPAINAAMAAAVAAGKIYDAPCGPTLSDGTAGGIEPGSFTFPLCRDLVDTWIEVSEAEIAMAVRSVLHNHQMLIEGAAGVAVAAAISTARSFPDDSRIGIVLCGANIGADTLKAIL